jgi:hypothetical protein
MGTLAQGCGDRPLQGCSSGEGGQNIFLRSPWCSATNRWCARRLGSVWHRRGAWLCFGGGEKYSRGHRGGLFIGSGVLAQAENILNPSFNWFEYWLKIWQGFEIGDKSWFVTIQHDSNGVRYGHDLSKGAQLTRVPGDAAWRRGATMTGGGWWTVSSSAGGSTVWVKLGWASGWRVPG